MILPPKLVKGDAIGVFSPSSPATATAEKRFERAKKLVEERGYRIVEGKLTGKQDFYRSGSVKERADEFNQLVADKDVKCIMSSIGGMNSNSILPYIDYKALAENPKIIVGYSDVTALLLGIYAKTGLITYYGPALVAALGEFPPFSNKTFDYFENIVSGNEKTPYTLPTPSEWTDAFVDWNLQDKAKNSTANHLATVCEGICQGRLIGGNLNTMSGIWGSEYMPMIKEGDVLFIEDSLKDIATIERSFSHLKLCGVFDKIGGLILGKHECFDDLKTGRTQIDVLKEIIGKVNFPVLSEFDCCHTHPMLTLPIGISARLDSVNQTLTLTCPFIG